MKYPSMKSKFNTEDLTKNLGATIDAVADRFANSGAGDWLIAIGVGLNALKEVRDRRYKETKADEDDEETFRKAQFDWEQQGLSKNEIADKTNELLTKIAASNNTNSYAGRQSITKFPKWLRDRMKSDIEAARGEIRHDVDNDIYKCVIPGELADAGDFIDGFAKAYEDLAKDNPDIQKWRENNQVLITPTGHDEQFEMRELERANPSQGGSQPPKKEEE